MWTIILVCPKWAEQEYNLLHSIVLKFDFHLWFIDETRSIYSEKEFVHLKTSSNVRLHRNFLSFIHARITHSLSILSFCLSMTRLLMLQHINFLLLFHVCIKRETLQLVTSWKSWIDNQLSHKEDEFVQSWQRDSMEKTGPKFDKIMFTWCEKKSWGISYKLYFCISKRCIKLLFYLWSAHRKIWNL